MTKDESKDYQFFECDQQQDLDYVAGLYNEKEKVYDLLYTERNKNTISYSTHVDIYELIEDKLGYPVPS
jgi:hypothetical protein